MNAFPHNAFPAMPGGGSDLDLPHIRPSGIEEQPPIPQQLVEIHGWGRAAGAMSHLHGIESVADAVSALRQRRRVAGSRPAGSGRSYGDAAQNSGGTTLDLTRLDKILSVDAASEPPTVTLQAGVSIDTLMKALLPFGLWVPGAPGHPAGDRRRCDRGGRARQEPPHAGQLRQPRPFVRPAHGRRLRTDARAAGRWLVGRARRRRPAVLGDDRRDGPDRRDRRRRGRAAARGDGVLHRRHRPVQRHRRPDGPDEHGRRRVQLLGRLVRRGDQGQAHGPRRADPRRQGHAVPARPQATPRAR